MSITENEALASLRILAAVARADGTVHNDERRSLAAALESFELPQGLTVDRLLAEDIDVPAQLASLASEEARDQIYRSAYFMAYADGACTKEEQALLDKIAQATDVSPETRASLDRTFVGRAKGGDGLSGMPRIDDPEERAKVVESRIRRHAILSAALGAFPIPGLSIATDLAVVGLQLKMISEIGGCWGHRIDRAGAKSLLYGVGLGTGARLAVNGLAKLVPVWGALVGATTSFVSTFALGRVMNQFFAAATPGQPQAAAVDQLRSEYKRAEEAARSVYSGHADVIIQSQRENKASLDAMTAALKAGEITQDEFDAQVATLV
jgi:uncharacterized protein (DUF697 family)/uncharacterized tellurite resistance protein B-like protein